MDEAEMDGAGGGMRRPMNAFLIFCKRHRSLVRDQNPHLDNRAVTRILGDLWANLGGEEKDVYFSLSKQYKEAYMKANPDYKWFNHDKHGAPPPPRSQGRPSGIISTMLNGNHDEDAISHKLADPSDMGGLSLLLQAHQQQEPAPPVPAITNPTINDSMKLPVTNGHAQPPPLTQHLHLPPKQEHRKEAAPLKDKEKPVHHHPKKLLLHQMSKAEEPPTQQNFFSRAKSVRELLAEGCKIAPVQSKPAPQFPSYPISSQRRMLTPFIPDALPGSELGKQVMEKVIETMYSREFNWENKQQAASSAPKLPSPPQPTKVQPPPALSTEKVPPAAPTPKPRTLPLKKAIITQVRQEEEKKARERPSLTFGEIQESLIRQAVRESYGMPKQDVMPQQVPVGVPVTPVHHNPPAIHPSQPPVQLHPDLKRSLPTPEQQAKKPCMEPLLARNNDDDEDASNVRKSKRSNRGQRYQQLISEGVLHSSRKKSESSASEDANNNSSANEVTQPSVPLPPRRRTFSEVVSDVDNTKRYITGDFDLEAHIASLPACNTTAHRKPCPKSPRGRSRHHSEPVPRPSQMMASVTAAKPTKDDNVQTMNIVEIRQICKRPEQILKKPLVGSQKRKARKFSITHLVPVATNKKSSPVSADKFSGMEKQGDENLPCTPMAVSKADDITLSAVRSLACVNLTALADIAITENKKLRTESTGKPLAVS